MADVTPIRAKKAKPQTNIPREFAMGGLVKLRSGGSLMCITAHLVGEPPAVHCEWQTADFMPMEKSYPVACLRVATEEEEAGTYDEAEANVDPDPE